MSGLTWQFTGAWTGGTVHDVAASPNLAADGIALAATRAGVFRSTDGGVTWSRAREAGARSFNAVAFAPRDPRVALAAAADGELRRSVDAGVTWRRVEGWAFGPILALALAPEFPSNPSLFAAAGDGIYRSLDGGASWQSANFGLLEPEVLCLALAPDFAASEVGWAGSAAGGLYRTRNAGRAWREAGQGLADSAVQCLAHSGAVLYAGTEGAGVLRSANGTTWAPFGLAGALVNCLAVGGGRVLAGTSDGIFFRVEDGDADWRAAEMPADLADSVLSLAVSPDAGVVLAGLMSGGILRSGDGGRSWRRANAGLCARVPPTMVAAPGGALFAADELGNLARSTDDGATWQPCPADAGEARVEHLAAGGRPGSPLIIAATSRRVLRWEPADGAFAPMTSSPELEAIDAISAVHVTPQGELLVGTRSGAAFASTDGGATWHPIPVPGRGPLAALRLTPSGGVYALRLAELGGAPSGGAHAAELWRLPALVLPATSAEGWHLAMALDALRLPLASLEVISTASSERAVLAGQHVVAVGAPAEGGAFFAAQQHLPQDAVVTSLARHGRYLLAGTSAGAFASADGGATWTGVEGELGRAPIAGVIGGGRAAYAIALGGEVWRAVSD